MGGMLPKEDVILCDCLSQILLEWEMKGNHPLLVAHRVQST